MGRVLTAELLASVLPPGADVRALTSVSLARHELSQLHGLDACPNLMRLDMSDNQLTNVEAVSFLKDLKWLSVSGNSLTSVTGLGKLKKLTVLNCSKNAIANIGELCKLKELRALIINDNQVESVPMLDRLVNLNTLVLSHNPICKLGDSLSKLTSLKKLSLSSCKLTSLGTSLINCIALEELRLAHNKLKVLPKELELNARLRIVDLGNNSFRSWKTVQVLPQLPRLENLNLRGNPFCDESDYSEKVRHELPKLRVFDGRAINSTSLKDVKQKKQRKQDAFEASKQLENETVEDDAEVLFAPPEERVEAVARNPSNSRREKDSKVAAIELKNNRKRQKVSSAAIADALHREDIGLGGASAWDT